MEAFTLAFPAPEALEPFPVAVSEAFGVVRFRFEGVVLPGISQSGTPSGPDIKNSLVDIEPSKIMVRPIA